MELRINCDASVKLKKVNGTRNVNCNVIDYKIKKDTLTGNIMINGIYIKDELDKEYEFSELVPFTVVFRDENFEVTDIRVENFNNNDIVNQSVDCHFDIVITYDERKPIEEAEVVSEETVEETVEEKGAETQEGTAEENEEGLTDADKISNKYDEMLQEILTKRNDNFLEEFAEEIEEKAEIPEVEAIPIKQNIAINLTEGTDDVKQPVFKTLKESYQSYTIYFINNDNDIDKICKNENLNINDVYEDYSKNRRIIVK